MAWTEHMVLIVAGYKNIFKNNFPCYLLHFSHTVDWTRIQPMPAEQQYPYEKLAQVNIEQRQAILNRLVVVKLNGGLGKFFFLINLYISI